MVGVAPGARLWAVRVLDEAGNGSWSSVICGVDWVTAHAADIEVANPSLAGPGSTGTCSDGALRQAICRSVEAGVTYTAAAGNSAVDVSGQVPSSFPEVITVSALTDYDGLPGGLARPTCRAGRDDTLADFSPTSTPVSTSSLPASASRQRGRAGGTARRAARRWRPPHVAGAATLYLSDHPAASPSSVAGALRAAGNLFWDAAGDRDGVKERLVDVDSLIGSTVGGGGSARGGPATSPNRR